MKKALVFLPIILNCNYADPIKQELDEIFTQSEQDFSFTNKSILQNEDFINRQVSDLKEMFFKESSIDVGGGGKMAQKLYIRGMEDRLLRVKIDGSAQNGNAFHHQGNLVIDPFMIKKIEIIKGSANASAGPGAIAGSVDIITKDALDFLERNQNFGVFFGSSFFSNFGVKENLAIYGSDHKNFDILAAYDFVDIFYYRDGKHIFTNLFHPTPDDKVISSPSMQNNLLLKSNIFFNTRDKITLSYNLVNDDAIRPFRANITRVDPDLSGGVDYAQILFKHKNINQNFSIAYEKKGTKNFNEPKIKLNAYGNIRNVKLTPYSIGNSAMDEEEASLPRNIFLNNFGLDLKVAHTLKENKQNTFEYGLNYQNISTLDKKALKDNLQRGREDGHIIGGYIQANYYILGNLSLGAGSRYDSYFYYDKNYQNHHTYGFSPSVVIFYNPVDSLDLKLSYSYVTRGALPGDALLLQNEHHFVDKNLKAEKGQNIEFDIDYNHEYFSVRGAVFYQNIKDFINSYGSGHSHGENESHAGHEDHEDTLRDNLDSLIDIYGFEAGIDYFFKSFLASFSFSRSFPMVKGKLIADTYELGAAIGNTYVIKLGYDFKSSGISISWVSKIVQRLNYTGYDIYNNEISNIDKKGYHVHNFYLTYIHPKHKNCSLQFAIENIFNQYYINQASPFKVEADGSANEVINAVRRALPEPGINAKISFSYKF